MKKEFLEVLLNQIIDWIWITDENLNIIYCNNSIESYGYNIDDLIGSNISSILSDIEIKCIKDNIQDYYNDPTVPFKVVFIKRFNKNTNKYHDIEIVASTFKVDDKLIGFCGISRDVTVTREIEKENIQMRHIMEIIGGLCHEISQPLQIITGYMDILKMLYNIKELEIIDCQLNRINDIIRKFQVLKKYKTKDYLNGKIIDIG